MPPTLCQLTDPYETISIIGMCKNAGKTTVLDRLIRELDQVQIPLGLTSIGRDGEDKDLVTGTKKPGIYVRSGTLIATASDLVLSNCDITREIVDTTGIFTPMGQVVLVKARSDGSVQLAGPSTTQGLVKTREQLKTWGAKKIIIDGALSRKTLCSRAVSDATVLCTGASYHKNLDTVIEDTAFHCRMLTLPEVRDPWYRQAIDAQEDPRATLLLTDHGCTPVPRGQNLEEAIKKHGPMKVLFWGGALSDFALKPLLMSALPLKDTIFLVRDSSKLLIKGDTYEKLLRRGISLQVLDSVNLVALTVNPFSAYGYHCSKDELRDRMQQQVDLPVINVLE